MHGDALIHKSLDVGSSKHIPRKLQESGHRSQISNEVTWVCRSSIKKRADGGREKFRVTKHVSLVLVGLHTHLDQGAGTDAGS